MTIHQHIAAGIDLGSNTFRLLVAGCSAGHFQVLVKESATVRLGRGLDDKSLLHRDAMQQGLAVLRSFRATLRQFHPGTLRVCGTEALRRARNSPSFLQQAEEILQQPVEIISGEEEARLSLDGALSGCSEIPADPLLLVDVGGGSTELLFSAHPAGETRIKSIPIGAVRLTEKYIAGPRADLAGLDSLLAETLHGALAALNLLHPAQPLHVTGCGGTATSMAALDLRLAVYNESLVHGHMLQSGSIEKLWHRLMALSAEKRNAIPCLGEGRGEILPAGIMIYREVLKLLRQDQMRVSDTGLLEGIMLSSLPRTDA